VLFRQNFLNYKCIAVVVVAIVIVAYGSFPFYRYDNMIYIAHKSML